MAEVVRVVQLSEDDAGFVFEVSIGELKYKVTLTREYYEKLTGGKITQEELVRKSFEFLLEPEPASPILPAYICTS